MADAYYVRIRGEIRGPLSREQILLEIRKKRLGRHHELSEDAVQWQRAGDIPDLFEVHVAPQIDLGKLETVAAEAPKQETPKVLEEESSAGWYFAKGHNNIGPLKIDDIKSMLATGRLKGTTRVWHNSLQDWTPASELPQFVGLVVETGKGRGRGRVRNGDNVPRANILEVIMGTSKGASLPDDAIYKFPNLTRYLLIAEGAFRIMFVILLLAVVGGFVLFAGQQVPITSTDLPTSIGLMVGTGFALVLQILMLWLLFISCLAVLELARVLIKIEDNTSQPMPNNE